MFYKWHHVFGLMGAAPLHLLYFVVRGNAIAPREVTLARVRACGSCAHLDGRSRRCKLCSCYVDLKTRLAHQRCPARLWRRLPLFGGWEEAPRGGRAASETSARSPCGSVTRFQP